MSSTGPRFIVTELEGFLGLVGMPAHPGLSVQVLDRAVCHRVVASFRTEDRGNTMTRDRKRRVVRYQAAKLCAELNGTPPPSLVSMLGGGTCRNGHERTEQNTFYRGDGLPRCLICRREANQRSERKRRNRHRRLAPPVEQFSPACPQCGDLVPAGSSRCPSCDVRLTP